MVDLYDYPEARRTVSIDVTQPCAVVEVDDLIDNQHWQWCEDDVDALVPTYNDFPYGPDDIVPAGKTVVIEYLWGFGDDGLTEPVNYSVTLPTDAEMKRVLHLLLSCYHDEVQRAGAGGRFFFIEGVVEREDGTIEIVWGT